MNAKQDAGDQHLLGVPPFSLNQRKHFMMMGYLARQSIPCLVVLMLKKILKQKNGLKAMTRSLMRQ